MKLDKILQLLLTALALAVCVLLLTNRTPWYCILAYWLVTTIRNFINSLPN